MLPIFVYLQVVCRDAILLQVDENLSEKLISYGKLGKNLIQGRHKQTVTSTDGSSKRLKTKTKVEKSLTLILN